MKRQRRYSAHGYRLLDRVKMERGHCLVDAIGYAGDGAQRAVQRRVSGYGYCRCRCRLRRGFVASPTDYLDTRARGRCLASSSTLTIKLVVVVSDQEPFESTNSIQLDPKRGANVNLDL